MKDIELKIETVRTSDLVPYAGNAKEHPAEQVEHIADRIEREYMELPILEGEPLKVGDKVDGYSQEGTEVVAIMNEKMVVVRSTVKGGTRIPRRGISAPALVRR